MRWSPDAQELLAAVRAAGGVTFDDALYDLNLVGVRTLPGTPDAFDDAVFVAYRNDLGNWRCEKFPATLDPGRAWLEDPTNTNGSVILAPGQYRGAFTPGLHKGVYRCLVARTPLRGWRDRDRDGEPDRSGPIIDISVGAGIHIHRANASRPSKLVGRWSDGCTVIADPAHFAQLMWLVDRQIGMALGDKFTYTVLEREEVPEREEAG